MMDTVISTTMIIIIIVITGITSNNIQIVKGEKISETVSIPSLGKILIDIDGRSFEYLAYQVDFEYRGDVLFVSREKSSTCTSSGNCTYYEKYSFVDVSNASLSLDEFTPSTDKNVLVVINTSSNDTNIVNYFVSYQIKEKNNILFISLVIGSGLVGLLLMACTIIICVRMCRREKNRTEYY